MIGYRDKPLQSVGENDRFTDKNPDWYCFLSQSSTSVSIYTSAVHTERRDPGGGGPGGPGPGDPGGPRGPGGGNYSMPGSSCVFTICYCVAVTAIIQYLQPSLPFQKTPTGRSVHRRTGM